MPKKKAETVEAVEADPIAPDMIPNDDADKDPNETDFSKPISASNPPPSKRPLREQTSPVSDGDKTLQKDERGVDEELEESEKEVARKTGSTGRRTRVTDTGADVGGDQGSSNNVSTTTNK